jgi:hypothetical protein
VTVHLLLAVRLCCPIVLRSPLIMARHAQSRFTLHCLLHI